jgi:hypothetical protein
MNDESEIWELRRGDISIGTLNVTDQDVSWYSAQFEPTLEFALYSSIFEEGNGVRSGDDEPAWSTWRKKVHELGLRLIRLHDQAVASEFILYIDGSTADFRPHFDS